MKTCLVVDDSSVIRKVARRILEGLDFQIMEAEDVGMLQVWASRWEDLARFEIVPVLTSQQFWAEFGEKART